MFPAAIEVIETVKPRAFILENVRGLTRAAFANYYQYIQLRLSHPSVASAPGETWIEHFRRLQRKHTAADSQELTYVVLPTLVDAADYGVPQHRHRVFMIGFRSDVHAGWSFPEETHSLDALLRDQWVTGEYWDRHGVPKSKRGEVPERLRKRVDLIKRGKTEVEGLPWKTVRDAIGDLPDPALDGSDTHFNHNFQDGARQYKGHTGSQEDLPAKTLKAGGHGVPGGENMLVRRDGSVRYFTIREAARLQTFPDDYVLHGAWGEAMRQLGNAVPVSLARSVASSVASHLSASRFWKPETHTDVALTA